MSTFAECTCCIATKCRRQPLLSVRTDRVMVTGAAVTQVGEECFRLCNELVDDMVCVRRAVDSNTLTLAYSRLRLLSLTHTLAYCNDRPQVVVTNDELCAAIENTFEETRSMLEPAG